MNPVELTSARKRAVWCVIARCNSQLAALVDAWDLSGSLGRRARITGVSGRYVTNFGTVLVEQPDGTWAERLPLPSHLCPLDQPLRRYLVGWLPCRCGGHRTVRCEEDHGHTEADRTKYHPPLAQGCAAPVVRGVGDDVEVT